MAYSLQLQPVWFGIAVHNIMYGTKQLTFCNKVKWTQNSTQFGLVCAGQLSTKYQTDIFGLKVNTKYDFIDAYKITNKQLYRQIILAISKKKMLITSISLRIVRSLFVLLSFFILG